MLARRQRIALAKQAESDRRAKFHLALHLIKETLKYDDEVAEILHATSSRFCELHGPDSAFHDVVIGLDELADSITYRDEA